MAVSEKGLTESEVKASISNRFQHINSSAGSTYGDLIAQSANAYERQWKRKMPESSKAILLQSFNQMARILESRDHYSKEAITSAMADIAKVDNPITLAFNLMSILIPNFAYTEVIGLQPIPTKESPVFYPQISASKNPDNGTPGRNNVANGSVLLGSTNWNEHNTFTTNKVKVTIEADEDVTFIADEGNIIPGTLTLQYSNGTGVTAVIFDDGSGKLIHVDTITDSADPGTIDYAIGKVIVHFDDALGVTSDDNLVAQYRYEFSDTTKPAQAVLEWVTKRVRAEPYRIRTTYDMDNFFQVKQVLSGYNIDQVLSSSVAGYINKEISGNVFDDLLLKADADYEWISTAPEGVAWALHRLSLIQEFIRAGNGIRQNIARAGGNIAVCGNEWMNFIETLGDDLWKPQSYSSEPIGPYVAGTLAGKFKILKNQDYPEDKAVMVYKRDEVDASFIGGVFIGLYSTNPIAMDDLKVIQGMGTQFGWLKAFDNSVVSLTLNAA